MYIPMREVHCWPFFSPTYRYSKVSAFNKAGKIPSHRVMKTWFIQINTNVYILHFRKSILNLLKHLWKNFLKIFKNSIYKYLSVQYERFYLNRDSLEYSLV